MFDSSTPIAVSHIHRADLFNRLGLLGYELIIPSHVEREELIGADVGAMIRGLLDCGVIRIARMNRRREVFDFGENLQGLELGECDAILTCIKMRRRGVVARCVLGDKKARAAAGRVGIGRIGLVGLLDELASAGAVSAQDMGSIVAALRRSNFHIGDNLLDGLARGV